ncbi:hypothetical protein C5F44_03785 [Fuscovulum blasticum DSM 2131]|uniref:OmpA-like domain-containing protein n=2 Tax=Fuscovulum blasticum TaxID=1075 RepID=A0A2T4JE32_FUSBL|nr:hypothetical protein C5F44_03785 [Fuscovulum blasticum DSM 2131]
MARPGQGGSPPFRRGGREKDHPMLSSIRLLTVAAVLSVTSCTYIATTPSRPYTGTMTGGTLSEAAARQERELTVQLAGSGASITNTGNQLRVILPEAVSFAPGSVTLTPGFMPALREVARSLNSHPSSTIRVVGHTDSVGSEMYNKQLSQERALAVARALIRYGVPSSRISYSGRGSGEPITSNATAAGRAMNQRVEVVITPTN